MCQNFLFDVNNIVYIHHSFLSHSFVDGSLGCSCLLAVVNNAAVNTGGQIPLRDPVSILSGMCPQVGLLEYVRGNSIFNFLRNCNTISNSG